MLSLAYLVPTNSLITLITIACCPHGESLVTFVHIAKLLLYQSVVEKHQFFYVIIML